jgi:trk system potassium uptake protein
MKVVVVGCGRVGSVVAGAFDSAGHNVTVIDRSTAAFDRLPAGFGGDAVRGDGTDEDVLRKAGAEGADVFLALTEGDNRNVMSAQLATEALHATRVVAKINDPLRAAAYSELGLATICRTDLMSNAILTYSGLPTTGSRGVVAPTGQHAGGEHHLARDGSRPGAGRSAEVRQLGREPLAAPSSPEPDSGKEE